MPVKEVKADNEDSTLQEIKSPSILSPQSVVSSLTQKSKTKKPFINVGKRAPSLTETMHKVQSEPV